MHKVFRYSRGYVDVSLKRLQDITQTAPQRAAVTDCLTTLPPLWEAAKGAHLDPRQAHRIAALARDIKIAVRHGAAEDALTQADRIRDVLRQIGGLAEEPGTKAPRDDEADEAAEAYVALPGEVTQGPQGPLDDDDK